MSEQLFMIPFCETPVIKQITYFSASQIVSGGVSFPNRLPAAMERAQSSAFFGSEAIIFILGLILCIIIKHAKNVHFTEAECKYITDLGSYTHSCYKPSTTDRAHYGIQIRHLQCIPGISHITNNCMQ